MARILVDLTPLFERKITGVEIYGIEMYQALLKTGHEVCPIFRMSNTIDDNTNSIIIPHENRLIVENYYLPKVIRKAKAQAVFFPIFPPPFTAYDGETKILPTIHDLAFMKYASTLSWKARAYLTPKYNIALKKSNQIITISNAVKTELEQVTNLPICNLGNNISESYRSDNLNFNSSVLKKYALNKGKYLISVSTLEPRKNLLYLIKAWSDLKNHLIDYKLVLTGRIGWGQDSEMDRYLSQVKDSIVFTGYTTLDELKSLYHYSGAFALLSHYEGFGRTPLEAIACGAKVIVSDIPIFRENLHDFNVYFVPLDDLETTVLKIKCALDADSPKEVGPITNYFGVLNRTIQQNINTILM